MGKYRLHQDRCTQVTIWSTLVRPVSHFLRHWTLWGLCGMNHPSLLLLFTETALDWWPFSKIMCLRVGALGFRSSQLCAGCLTRGKSLTRLCIGLLIYAPSVQGGTQDDVNDVLRTPAGGCLCSCYCLHLRDAECWGHG
jgi:hypothetical protein